MPPTRYPPPGPAIGREGFFVWMDRYLDTTRVGPMFLRCPEVAATVVKELQRGVALLYYDLRAFVVMANHVHVLLRPKAPASRVLQWLKGVAAREANLLLGRTGQPFWLRESYGHVVRDEWELERIVAYIENNPVKPGLVGEACQYVWSSAWEGRNDGTAG